MTCVYSVAAVAALAGLTLAALAFSGCTGADSSVPATNLTGVITVPVNTGAPTGSTTGTGTGTGAGSGGNPSGVSLDAEEAAFVDIINAYRAQNGLGALKVSIALTQASKWMSADMAAHDTLNHTDTQGRDPFTRMADFGYPQNGYSGENIACGNAGAQATFTQWKNSPGHNANMLGANYTVIGVGRAQAGSGSVYGWYWTTDFGSTVDATL